jgi:hypothetical protein
MRTSYLKSSLRAKHQVSQMHSEGQSESKFISCIHWTGSSNLQLNDTSWCNFSQHAIYRNLPHTSSICSRCWACSVATAMATSSPAALHSLTGEHARSAAAGRVGWQHKLRLSDQIHNEQFLFLYHLGTTVYCSRNISIYYYLSIAVFCLHFWAKMR